MSDERLKIAVFIDFDNIEIGVKTTLGQHFDVGSVLEAIKERGEIVTKIAYGDWTRAGDYGRAMSQHAIHMVQRNLTPGGDKNGADINLALDALEMAFTHNHINSFVIVGGDSDFISLVEKLKQYDRKVFVVGGRAFTSLVMQKNCTEFLSYENLVGRGKPAPRGSKATGELAQAMPLVRRALKLLADREVLPQLGLLKSTLLQLDSAFSERDYGASSFRDFVQKLANAGLVVLKGNDRSFHVELRESGEPAPTVAPTNGGSEAPEPPSAPAPVATPAAEPPDTPRLEQADALRVFQQAFQAPRTPPRWPMYVRQVKQFVKAVDPQFDERAYGFGGIIEALRFGQREGLFRVERDRLGVVRVFPGPDLQRPGADGAAVPQPESDVDTGTMLGAGDAQLPAETETPVDVVPVLDEDVPVETDTAPQPAAAARAGDGDVAIPVERPENAEPTRHEVRRAGRDEQGLRHEDDTRDEHGRREDHVTRAERDEDDTPVQQQLVDVGPTDAGEDAGIRDQAGASPPAGPEPAGASPRGRGRRGRGSAASRARKSTSEPPNQTPRKRTATAAGPRARTKTPKS